MLAVLWLSFALTMHAKWDDGSDHQAIVDLDG
jgi:hypothetical protein